MRRTWQFTFLFVCFLISSTVKSQFLDSLSASFKHRPKLTAFFDTRNSLVNNEFMKMRGIKGGLTFNKTVTIAAGYNWMEDLREPIDIEDTAGVATNKAFRQLWYVSGYFEYVFYKSKHWDASIPLQIGAGRTNQRYLDVDNEAVLTPKKTVVFYEASMTLVYKPIKYIGLGGGLGYRLTLFKPKEVTTRFTAPLYTLKFNIYFGEIFNAIF